MKKVGSYISRKDELRGRILFIFLTLIPIIAAFVINFSLLKLELLIFVVISTIVVLLNLFMSKTFRKNNPIITDETAQELIQDKNFNPAMLSRVITFLVSVIASIILALLMNDSEILHPIMFFFIGYVYFTMIQFKRL